MDADLSIRERAAFWAALPERLDQIANWIGPDQRTKLLATLRARIPTVTSEEQSSIRPEDEDAENDPKPTEDDIRAMRDVLGDDPTFAALAEARKAALFTRMFGMMWVAGVYDVPLNGRKIDGQIQPRRADATDRAEVENLIGGDSKVDEAENCYRVLEGLADK